MANGWFYLPDPSPPYEDTGVWDPHAWWDPDEDAVDLIGGWLNWPENLEWEELAAGDPEDWDWDNWEPNDKVFVLRHPRQLAGPGGPGVQPLPLIRTTTGWTACLLYTSPSPRD